MNKHCPVCGAEIMAGQEACPFCGGKPFVSARLPYFGETPTVAVVCEDCNAASKHRVKEEDAIEARWENVKETEVYSPDHRCTFTHTAETCSVCKIRSGFVGSKFYLYDAYCPNCGAKMDGDGNGC